MRLLILNEGYPHENNIPGDAFVHVRVKEYAKSHEVKVFSYFHAYCSTRYEGIPIECFPDIESLKQAVINYKPDRILIHFYQSWMLEEIIRPMNIPVVIWVHGYEALGWYRRLFNFNVLSAPFRRYIKRNTKQQWHFRKLLKYANATGSVQFVFVSDWMRRITAFDSFSKIRHYHIIANPIDTSLFRYEIKEADKRKSILILRSFHTRKYANDLSVKAILALSKKSFFPELHFTIIGEGQLFDKTVKPLLNFPNISIKKGFLKHEQIPAVHKEHGIFLCPTRQDAQGVSMCEAMSSGLVPVTSANTAIPEYVDHNQTGILTHSAAELADAITDLYHHAEKFLQLSSNAAKSVREKCDIVDITRKELSIIES